MAGLLDLISARNPQEAQGLLSDLVAAPRNRLRGLLDDPAGFINSALREALGADQQEKAWAWRKSGIDAVTGSPDTRASVDNDSMHASMNNAMLGGMIKGQMGRIPQTHADTNKLADILERAAMSKGYRVTREGSSVSPSQYVTLYKEHPETLERLNEMQVRLSNHADKYPELANGVRSSVDPITGTTFEQAVNWLARNGYPTNLSARYKNIPSWEQHYSMQRIADGTKEVKLTRLIDAWRNKPKASRGPIPTLDDVK